MKCADYVEARVLAGCGEKASRHVASCPACSSESRDFQEIRRLYAEARPVRLNDRTRRTILSSIRRERSKSRLRTAMASIAGMAAAVLILATIGHTPSPAIVSVTAPAGSKVDSTLAEVRARLVELEKETPACIDTALEDLKTRVGSLSWDAENL
jgi:anti-sigma factor RsiW